MSIDYDRLDSLCQRVPCSEFKVIAARLTYTDLCQLDAELDSRIGTIDGQLHYRADRDNHEWSQRARAALAVQGAKREFVRRRLADIRESAVASLAARLGGHGEQKVIIRCLLNVIDRYCNFGWVPESEQAAIDLARDVSGYSASPDAASTLGTTHAPT
jgi:hypothetical protein